MLWYRKKGYNILQEDLEKHMSAKSDPNDYY